jgi:tetratricopeptide (TPR) repeat protein
MLIKSLLAFVLTVGLVSSAMAAGSSSSSSKPSNLVDAQKAIKAGDFNNAIGLLETMISGDSENADAWNLLGFSQRNLMAYDQALVSYQKSLAIEPEHLGANEYLGELYLRTDKLDKAKERLKVLDDACTFGCDQYDDLKQAIEAYEASNQG